MATQHKSFWAGLTCLLFVFSAAMGFLMTEVYEGHYNLPETEKNTLLADAEPQKPRQFRWEERYQLCEQYQLDCAPVAQTGDANTEALLRSLSLSELANRYPLPEWGISEADGVVTICHNVAGLCPTHQQSYHLGSNENGQYLAVYFGPSTVGDAAGAFLITDVPLDRLSAEQIADMHAGRYEYYSQDELIAVLDNFSEL